MTGQFDITPFLANRFKRFLAYLIDILPIIIVTLIAFYFFWGFDQVMTDYINNPEDPDKQAAFLEQRNWISRISFSIWIFYCVVMESSSYQATVGKLVVSIKVVDEFGQPMTLEKSAIRNVSKLVSMVVFSLGFLWILIDRNKQGWHDKFARTYVVDQVMFDKAMKQGTDQKGQIE